MKTRVMKKKFRRMLCASMAAIFVMSDMIPVASAQGTAAETLPAPTDIERIVGFEMVNPLNSYEIKTGESLESLDTPEKIRVIVELPEDTKLSTFEEGEAPEQTDDTLPAYEYSHTLEQLSMSSEEDTASSGEEAAPSGEDTASSEDSSGTATSEDPSSAQEPSYTEEEIAGIYQESLTKKLGTVNVYALTDNAGASQYRVYGSIEAQAPQWYAIDENGVMLGAVEELDANWDFTGFDSTVAGEHQVKAQLPENYILSESVEMACLQIVVTQEEEEQSSIENEDGSLPDSLPVSYINALSATTASAATFPVIIEKEGSTATEKASFSGGEITSTSVPTVDNYLFIEETDAGGAVTSNGASLRVTVDGNLLSYNNVTAIYPVTQDDDSTVWFYTTTLSDGKVAWQVPKNAELVFRYKPDPNAPNAFTRITIASDDWKDGSATGIYEDGQRDYTALVPVGEEVSITVDLPSLYTAYKDNIRYTNISASAITETNTRTQLSSEWGPSKLNGKWVNDTVTFTFTVPQLQGNAAQTGVRIDLKFLSYMREYYNGQNDSAKQSTNETLWLRINQDYPTLAPYPGNATAQEEWKGQRAIRIFEQPGTVDFRYASGSVQYRANSGGSYKNASKTAYQNLGPDALMSDMNVASSNWQNLWSTNHSNKEVQTYWSTYSDSDSPNSMQDGAYAMYVMSSAKKQSSKEIAADANEERTLYFVYQNTLRNLGPTYDGNFGDGMGLSGQDLPIGVMLYSQNHSTGIFVPLESQLSMSDPNATGSHEVMAEVEIAGMTVLVTREEYDVQDYRTNMTLAWPDRQTAKVRNWTYTVQVQGATGYLGADFITSVDTQNNLSLTSISPNVEKVEVLATQGGDSRGAPLVWQTVDSGKSVYVYQLGNNTGGTGQTSSTFNDFYDGIWGADFADRNGALPIRIQPKEGYGVPYLKFIDSTVTDETKLVAGLNSVSIGSNGSSSLTTTQINDQSNKTVKGRIQNLNGTTSSTLRGVVVEYLFGYEHTTGAWDGWGKATKFSIEADARVLAITYDLNGGSKTGDIPTDTVTTAWGNNYYVTTPTSIPTAPSGRGHFVGWRIKLPDGNYLKNADGNDIYLQPNQTVSTTDTTYFPEDRLAVGHGSDYKNKGYFNAVVVNLEADYSDSISEGQLVEGNIDYYIQKNVDVDINDADLSQEYQSFKEERSTAPFQQGYYVVNNVGDTHTAKGTTYVYNDPLSVYSGIADYDNSGSAVTLASFRYDKAINVSYNVNTDGKPDGVSAPRDTNQYTTVQNHQNIITLQSMSGLTADNQDTFQGWMAEGDSVVIPPDVTSINLDYHNAPNTTTIDGTEARLSKSVIQNIYNTGTITLDAVWNSLLPIQSIRGEGGADADVWNDQYKHDTVHEYYSGTDITMEAQFKYDFSTRDQILQEWGGNGLERTDKAPNGMAQYLDWSLYGIGLGDTADQNTKQVWSLRGSNENGLTGLKTKLELEDTDADSDGYATATITITIPGDQVTYDKLKNQVFYLFAWNDASNTRLGTSYTSTTSTDTAESPFNYIQANKPHSDYGGGHGAAHDNLAVANEYWFYKQMVPRGIKTTDNNLSLVPGSGIQWKNVNAQSQSFEVEFKYDNTIPWDVQDSVYNDANKTDNNAIRVVVAKKNESGTWDKLDRFNPDGTFGNGGQPDNYTIELVAPQNGSDTFKVRVTAANSVMAASADNYGTEFLVVAYNFQNGEESAPERNDSDTSLSNTVKMSDIVGTLGSNSVIGATAPAVQNAVTFYPKGVTLEGGTLSSSTTVSKPYWQPSIQQTAIFTFDTANGDYNTANLQGWFSPEGDNYHIGLYKNNGNSWSLVESNDTLQDSRKYIQDIQINEADGKVTVNYVIPAEENTSNTQYRLIAFYGNIDGNNNIEENTLNSVATDMDTASSDLAVVNITMNSSTFKKVVSNSGNLAWNAKHSPLGHMYNSNAANEGDNFVLTATFKYDINSKDIIQQYWDNKDTAPTTDDGMGRYLNWAMYGYNPRTGESSTWVIRERNVTGEPGSGIDQKINFTVDLSLGNQADAEGYAVATIKIIIPKEEFNYENMSQQALYLFAWNDATNQTVDGYKEKATDYKALMHSDASGEESPYTFLQSTGILNPKGFGNNIGGDGPSMAAKGSIASTYWYFNIVPRAITQTDDTQTDQTQALEVDNGDTSSRTISATFKYDNSIPWQGRQGEDNGSSLAGDQYDIRVGLYKKDYNGTWTPMAVWHGDGNFNAQGGSNYSLAIAPNEQASTFTVTATINSSVLGASYENYGAEYKIIAYNYANYSGGKIGTLLSNGQLNAAIGTTIPSNTTTVKMNPASMKSIDESGTATGTIDGVEFTTPKTAGEKTNIAFHFQGDGSSWLNGAGQSNAEMEQLFSTGGGNIIVSLWKRESNTDNFTFVDSFNKGTTSNPPASGTEDTSDYIKSVNLSKDTLNVEVQAGTDSNTDGTEYRVYAWYVTSNGNKVYDTSKITDASIFGKDTPVVSGTIPYATATVDMKNQAPDYYVTLPSNIILVDSDGNVKEAGTDNDISSQYAGAKAQVSYNTTNTGNIPPDQIPELTVEIENNVKMTSTAGTATDTHTVGVYFTDGYQNVTDGTQSGYVKLGTLSTIKNESGNSNKGQPGQTMPAGTTLPFYLNTKQGNDEEIYTASVTFWFDIMNTTP